eukprot:TRINITY_DN6846_c0_g1_i1.p2 TRINITY_DN6846_c0_g1~~TRINITY_DN6846_c0_g1_i1.p2  ORF type:complete len:326 (-),score=85.13 TRINITY_DN6846_c0_g1_i1:1520-2464(-)
MGSIRETVSFVYRRFLFYFFVAYFSLATIDSALSFDKDYCDFEKCRYETSVECTNGCPILITNLTFWFWAIHTLYFELELTHPKHTHLVRFFHGMSFNGSFMVMMMVVVLLIHNPSFIAERAKQEGLPLALMWGINIQIHFLPPILHIIDLLMALPQIRQRWKMSLKNSRVTTFLKTLWFMASPLLVCLGWTASGFTVQNVYGADIPFVLFLGVAGVTSAVMGFVWLLLVAAPSPWAAIERLAESKVHPLLVNSETGGQERDPIGDNQGGMGGPGYGALGGSGGRYIVDNGFHYDANATTTGLKDGNYGFDEVY